MNQEAVIGGKLCRIDEAEEPSEVIWSNIDTPLIRRCAGREVEIRLSVFCISNMCVLTYCRGREVRGHRVRLGPCLRKVVVLLYLRRGNRANGTYRVESITRNLFRHVCFGAVLTCHDSATVLACLMSVSNGYGVKLFFLFLPGPEARIPPRAAIPPSCYVYVSPVLRYSHDCPRQALTCCHRKNVPKETT